jgi:hypothetical protein
MRLGIRLFFLALTAILLVPACAETTCSVLTPHPGVANDHRCADEAARERRLEDGRTRCDRGDAEGCEIAGFIERDRQTVPSEEAMTHLGRACRGGRPLACTAIGQRTRGCQLGDATACAQASREQSARPETALWLAEHGCDLKDEASCLRFAVLLWPSDADRARGLLREQCARPERDLACRTLGALEAGAPVPEQ